MKCLGCNLALALLGLGLSPFAFAGQSQSSVVGARPSSSLQWKTVMSDRAELSIDWPQGAVAAQLTVTCGSSSAVTNLTDTTVSALPSSIQFPAEEMAERVLELTIDYKDAGGESLDVRTARLGLVRGVNGRSARCFTSSAMPKWRKVKVSAVLPVAADVTALSVDGDPVGPIDAPGWFWWRPEDFGEHEMSQTDSAGTVDVTLLAAGCGMTIILR